MKRAFLWNLLLVCLALRVGATGMNVTYNLENRGTNDLASGSFANSLYYNVGDGEQAVNLGNTAFPAVAAGATATWTVSGQEIPFSLSKGSQTAATRYIYIKNGAWTAPVGTPVDGIINYAYWNHSTTNFDVVVTLWGAYGATNNGPVCHTNVTVPIPDNSYTNQIVVTISNWMCGGPANPQQITYTGPLSGLTYQFSQVICSNQYPYSISESNIPPCNPQPVVFSVVNKAAFYRLMAVYNTHDEAGGFINESLVSPGDKFYWSNSIPCGVDISGYQFWSSDASGYGFYAQTGITNMASGWEGTNDLGNSLSGGGGVSGQTSVGPFTTLTNVPPANMMVSNQFPNVPWVTNDVVWSSGTNNDISHVTVAVEDSGKILYQAVQTAANQAHSDAGAASTQAHSDAVSAQGQGTANAQGIINQVGAAEQQAHTDAQTLQGNAATAAGLAHGDASGIIAAVNAVGNDVVAAGNVAHGDAGAILGAIGRGGSNSWNGDAAINGLTNWLGRGNSTLVGISNLLAGTNGGGDMGASNAMMMGMASGGTNVGAATAAVMTAFSSPLGYLSDTITVLATPPDVGADPGHSGAWEMNWMGGTVDFDPVHILPQAFSFCYGLVSWLLVVTYLYSVSQLYIKAVQVLSATQSGGVPDLTVFQGLMGLTFGEFFGGNFIGVIVAVIVPSLIIGLWVVVVTALITPIGSMLGAFTAISGVFSAVSSTGTGAMACHILFAAFPIGLLIQLVAARLTLQFTMSRVLLIAVGISRYLWGK